MSPGYFAFSSRSEGDESTFRTLLLLLGYKARTPTTLAFTDLTSCR